VNFPGSSLSCESINGSATISHAVTLGVYCEVGPDSLYFSDDLFFECAKSSSGFDVLYDEYGFSGARYSCIESAVFGSGSSSASQLIASVAIVTDTYWLSGTDSSCLNIETGPSSPAASRVPVTPTPTLGSNFPTRIPTMSPTMSRGELPTSVSIEQPSDSSSSARTAIVASVGSVVAVIAIGLSAFYLVSRRPDGSSCAKPVASISQASATKPSAAVPPGYSNIDGSSNVSSHLVPPRGEVQSSPSAASPTPPVMLSTAGTSSCVAVNASAVQPSNYEVDFKDQARSVVGWPSVLPAAVAVPVTDEVPFAVALDISVGSGDSSRRIYDV
jgi:hypothetical protein